MSARQYTTAQQQAIDLRGCDLLVSASAGSGKTTVMIERILALLNEGASLDEMAVCTFTKAAAADMREKLTRRLSALAEENAALAAQLKKLPQAEISTLHSFCSRVIQSYFYASDLDPSFEILDENESAALLDESAEQSIASALTQAEPDFLRLYEVMLSARKHKKLKQTVLKLCEFASVQPDPTDFLRHSALGTDDHDACIKQIAAHYSFYRARMAERALQLYHEIVAAGFILDEAAAYRLYEWIAGRETEPLRTPSLKKGSAFSSLHERLKKLKSDFTAFATERDEALALPDSAQTLPYVSALCALASDTLVRYGEAKRRRGYADYGDLEHETLKILSGETRDEVCAKYRYVFIDEYQDVNPLQEQILSRLTGRLFYVGDVKQSIYGFRLCAPRYFSQKRRQYQRGGDGKTLELNANFRSDSQILSLCNDVFSRVMTADFGGVDYAAEARFDASGRTLFSPSVCVKLVESNQSDDEPSDAEEGDDSVQVADVYGITTHAFLDKDSAQESETNIALSHIAELLTQNVTLEGKTRPIEPGDIAVLVRSRDKFTDLLLKKLRRVGIAASFTDKTSVLQHRSTMSLLSYMRLIDNAADDVMLAAVLRSPYVGLNDDQLAEIRILEGDEVTFYQAAAQLSEKNGETAEKLRRFFKQLNRYRALSRCVGVLELAGTIAAENDAFVSAAALGGEASAAALSAYLDRLAESKSGASLREYLTHAGEDDAPLSVPAPVHCVRVMTIHASKGLEFPFVLLCNLNKKRNRHDETGVLLTEPDRGLSLKLFDWDQRKAVETARYRLARLAQGRASAEEELRVLYVAMTRAQCQLTLIGSTPKSIEPCLPDEAATYMDWLYPVIADRAQLFARTDCVLGDAPPRRSQILGRSDPVLRQAIAKRTDFVFPVQPRRYKTSVTALMQDAADNAPRMTYIRGGEQDDRAAETGTAYHKLMQALDFYAPFESEWERLDTLYPSSVALCDKEKIRAAGKSMSQLAKGMQVYREQAFVYAPTGENSANTAELVQGVVDVLLICGDDAVVVDYKTTRADGLSGEAYRAQMDLYCDAVTHILKKNVKRRLLYAFALNDFVAI